MPTPGPLELVIILVIALLILGPGKLPGRRRRARQEHPRVPQGLVRRPGRRQRQRRHVAAARQPGPGSAPPRRPRRPHRSSPQPRRRSPSPRRPRQPPPSRPRSLPPTPGPGGARRPAGRLVHRRQLAGRLDPTMADADALRRAGRHRAPRNPTASGRPRAGRRDGHVARRPPRRAAHPAVPVDHRRRASASAVGFYFADAHPRVPPARRSASDPAPGPRRRRRVLHPAQDRARRRDHPGDAGPALPALGVHRARV